jgi:hypothetical protein
MMNTRTGNSNTRRPLTIQDLAEIAVKDYLLRMPVEYYALALEELAAKALSRSIWMLDGEIEPDGMLELCKKTTFRELRQRAERLQKKSSAAEAGSHVSY